MQIIIPMSGIGKRFIDDGYIIPKPLIVVNDEPIINHVINLFPHETKFHFICNDSHLSHFPMREILLKKVPSGSIHSVSVNNRKGPVDAVLQISDSISDDDEVIVSYCDYGTEWDYKEFLRDVRFNNVDGAIAAYVGFHPHMLGSDNYAFMTHVNKWVTDIQEKKPFTENKMNEYASNGTYYFKTGLIMKHYFHKLVEQKMDINGEYYVSLAYKLMCQDSMRIRIFEIQKMLQWGTPSDLEEYLQWSDYFKKKKTQQIQPPDTLHCTTILPMAGAGSRFQMEGYSTPKPLLPIHEQPMFIEAIECLPKSEHIVVVCQKTHLDAFPIKDLVSEKWNGTTIAIDHVTEGQACTCEIALRDISNSIPLNLPILITACDNGVYYNIEKYTNLVNDLSIDVIVWAFTNNPTSKRFPHMYAWLDVDSSGNIHDVSIKKPFIDKPNTHAIIGTMFFRRGQLFMEGLQDIYKNNIRTNNEFYVDNLLVPLIQKGYSVKVFEVDHYLCWGTPNDYKTYVYWDEHFNH